MSSHDQKLIRLLWAVIGVLVVGSAVGGVMLVHKANDLTNANAVYSGDVDSLRNQLREAKSQTTTTTVATPTTSTSPSLSATPSASPSPSVTPGP